MKYITLIIGLLVVGCGTTSQNKRWTGWRTSDVTPKPVNIARGQTVKEKAQKDTVIGEYEFKREDGDTHKMVFLENGVNEAYKNGKKTHENKWKIINKEIHVKYDSGLTDIHRINKDGSFTLISVILKDGIRGGPPKEFQFTYKKLK